MSRSDYSDDIDNWDLIRWRGQVASAIRGKRGQKLLNDLANALDAMPVKRLIKGELKENGEYCALGVVGEKRGLSMDDIDPDDPETVAKTFDIAEQLAREIVFQNDDNCEYKTPEQRWEYMRAWVQDKIVKNKEEK